jgi:AAA15 family ATPase/GTPase
MDFSIKHIKTAYEDSEKSPPCPYIKSPAWTWAIIGASGSGKSNLIRSLLSESKFLKNTFKKEHIFLFCPTASLNNDFKDYVDAENIYDGFDQPIIQELMNEQHFNVQNYGRKHTPQILIILDDVASNRALHSEKSIINTLAFGGRHWKISVIVTSQALKSISSKTRSNLNMITFFCGSNMNEISKYIDEYIPRRYKKETEDIIYNHAKKQYNFIHLNKSNPPDERYTLNFDTPITF